MTVDQPAAGQWVMSTVETLGLMVSLVNGLVDSQTHKEISFCGSLNLGLLTQRLSGS